MIELLLLGKRKGWERLKQAVEEALHLGTSDAEAVRHLMAARELTRSGAELSELGELQRYERPGGDCAMIAAPVQCDVDGVAKRSHSHKSTANGDTTNRMGFAEALECTTNGPSREVARPTTVVLIRPF